MKYQAGQTIEVDGEIVTAIQLKDVKKGEYIKRKPDSKKVHVKDDYCRQAGKYECLDTDDIWGNGILLKGTTIVWIGFTY